MEEWTAQSLEARVAAAPEATMASTACEYSEDVHYWVSAGTNQPEFNMILGGKNTFSETGDIPVLNI